MRRRYLVLGEEHVDRAAALHTEFEVEVLVDAQLAGLRQHARLQRLVVRREEEVPQVVSERGA